MAKKERTAKKVKTCEVFQTEACECGAAALSVILKYYGSSVALEEIRYRCGISRDGCSAKDLVLAGRQFGLEGHAYRVSLEKLKDAPKPAVLHWDFRHFVVLEKVTKHGAVINDPAKGRRKVTMEELDRNYTGIYITFTPTDKFQKQERDKPHRAFIKKRLQTDKPSVVFLFFSGLLLIVPGILIPIISNQFIDSVFTNNSRYVSMLVVGMALLYLYQIFMTWMRSFVLDRLQLKMSAVSADFLLNKMFRLPMLFFEQRYSGELATRLETDNQANAFLAGKYVEAILDLLTALSCLVVMLIYNVPLTLIGVAGAVVCFVITKLTTYRIESLNMKKQQDKSMLTGVFCAGISASESIKACGVENDYATELLGRYANYTETDQTLGRAQKKIDMIAPTVSSVFSMIVLIVGARFSIDGLITIGMLTAFTQLLSSFTAPINQLSAFTLSINGMKATFARVMDIGNAMQDERFSAKKNTGLDRKLLGEISLRHVTFGYSPNLPPILDDISFTARVGSRIGIVGSSGSGKSTLGKMVGGLLTPWSGEILLDDHPIQEIPDEWLSGSLAYVGQKGEFFCGSIMENITMWKQAYQEASLFQAVEDAQVSGFVHTLPGGMNYPLTEEGKNISGGQRQRLQIARGLLGDPAIVVLDEATSALDAVTELKVMKAIERRGCTCLIVAHRLSTIRNCDLILVLDHGKIAEAGTHDELMKKNGLYAELTADY